MARTGSTAYPNYLTSTTTEHIQHDLSFIGILTSRAPAVELRRRVETAIKELIDCATWNRQVAIQQVEFNCIAEFAATIKALPQLERQP